MSEDNVLVAEIREGTGKGPARAARREGFVPAVIYGDNKDPQTIRIERRVLEREINAGGFFSKLLDMKVGDETVRVLARDVQFHVVTDVPLHADFLRLSPRTRITIAVPVTFVNESDCPGLRQGGVLSVVRYEAEVNCRADSIPEGFEVDLTGLEIGDPIRMSAIALPEGVTPAVADRDVMIASIAAPSIVPSDEEDEEGEEGVEETVEAGADEDGEAGDTEE